MNPDNMAKAIERAQTKPMNELKRKLQWHCDQIREIGQLLRTDEDTIDSPSHQLRTAADIAESVAEDMTRQAVGEMVNAAFTAHGGVGETDYRILRERRKAA